MLRQAARTIARRIPAIGRLIKQRDDLLIDIERIRHQMASENSRLIKQKDDLLIDNERLRRQMARENVIARWGTGIKFERDFWANWLQTKGAQWPDDYRSKLDPDCALDQELASILLADPNLPSRYRILDVGAGPLSAIGKKMAGADVRIIAVDPLASIYDELLRAAKIEPPIRTWFAPAEGLSAFFEPSSFDLVYCANALDRSADPMRGIIEMLRVVRIGGSVVLRHARNQAENENYVGLRQYNVDLHDGDFVVWNKDNYIVVDKAMLARTKLTHRIVGTYLHSRIVKMSAFPDQPDQNVPNKAACARWEHAISAAIGSANSSPRVRRTPATLRLVGLDDARSGGGKSHSEVGSRT